MESDDNKTYFSVNFNFGTNNSETAYDLAAQFEELISQYKDKFTSYSLNVHTSMNSENY